MKDLAFLFIISLTFLTGRAQTIALQTGKTSSLVFTNSIKQIDRGSKDFLVRQEDNILFVKPGLAGFRPTNLQVITSDGKLYTFDVIYDDSATLFRYEISCPSNAGISTYANSIAANGRTIYGISSASWGVIARLAGIYIKDNMMYYQLWIENCSPVDYDIDFMRFYICDRKKGRRTAIQENELIPLFISNPSHQVQAGRKIAIVFALQKFTIPNAQLLRIEINEANGGRHLQMKISNRKIMQALPLPELT